MAKKMRQVLTSSQQLRVSLLSLERFEEARSVFRKDDPRGATHYRRER